MAPKRLRLSLPGQGRNMPTAPVPESVVQPPSTPEQPETGVTHEKEAQLEISRAVLWAQHASAYLIDTHGKATASIETGEELVRYCTRGSGSQIPRKSSAASNRNAELREIVTDGQALVESGVIAKKPGAKPSENVIEVLLGLEADIHFNSAVNKIITTMDRTSAVSAADRAHAVDAIASHRPSEKAKEDTRATITDILVKGYLTELPSLETAIRLSTIIDVPSRDNKAALTATLLVRVLHGIKNKSLVPEDVGLLRDAHADFAAELTSSGDDDVTRHELYRRQASQINRILSASQTQMPKPGKKLRDQLDEIYRACGREGFPSQSPKKPTPPSDVSQEPGHIAPDTPAVDLETIEDQINPCDPDASIWATLGGGNTRGKRIIRASTAAAVVATASVTVSTAAEAAQPPTSAGTKGGTFVLRLVEFPTTLPAQISKSDPSLSLPAIDTAETGEQNTAQAVAPSPAELSDEDRGRQEVNAVSAYLHTLTPVEIAASYSRNYPEGSSTGKKTGLSRAVEELTADSEVFPLDNMSLAAKKALGRAITIAQYPDIINDQKTMQSVSNLLAARKPSKISDELWDIFTKDLVDKYTGQFTDVSKTQGGDSPHSKEAISIIAQLFAAAEIRGYSKDELDAYLSPLEVTTAELPTKSSENDKDSDTKNKDDKENNDDNQEVKFNEQAFRDRIHDFTEQAIVGKGSPMDPDELADLLIAASKEPHHRLVTPELVSAILYHESSLNPNAVSPRGATGIAQFMPGTAAKYGLHNRKDPKDSIRAHFEYMTYLFELAETRFPGASDDDLTTRTLAYYNAGEYWSDLDSVPKENKDDLIPPFSETQKYVKNILASRNRTINEFYNKSTAVNPVSSTQCAPGTESLGMTTAYPGQIGSFEICAINGLFSSGQESTPGNGYYIPGANRRAIVAASLSGNFAALVKDAKAAGVDLGTVVSSYRTPPHQEELAGGNSNRAAVADKFGSLHVHGKAIDFSIMGASFAACKLPQNQDEYGNCVAPSSEIWKWLDTALKHKKYKLGIYSAESWHVDAWSDHWARNRGYATKGSSLVNPAPA